MTPTPRKAKAADAAAVTDGEAQAPPETAPAATDDDSGEDSGTDYLNVSGSPIVYSRDGHTVPSGEWTGPTNLDAIGRAARANGYLLPPSAL